jgi:uncharacterized protein
VTVDTHTHVWHSAEQWGPQIAALLRQRYAVPTDVDASPAAHGQAMSAVGAAFVLGFKSRRLGAEIPASLVQSCIEGGAGRLIGFAGIDPMDDGWADEFEAARSQKMAGVVISPSEQGFHPAHTVAMRLYDRCQAAGMPIIIHQGDQFVRDSMLEYGQPMLFDAVAREMPQLRMLITHCGHPFAEQTLTLIGKHPHVYAEISGLTHRPRQLQSVLLLAHQLEVTEKLLFGSDFPHQTPQRAIATIYSLNQLVQGASSPTVPREKLRGIVERDALAALGMKRSAGMPHKGQQDAKDAKGELQSAR